MFINAYVGKAATLWIVLLLLFPWPSLSANNSNSDTFQPSEPLTITEFEDSITIEWAMPADIIEEADVLESLSLLGWNNELLDHIQIPAYTFTSFENRATAPEETPSTEDRPTGAAISIDIDEQQVWPHSVELRSMPDLVGPTGELLPYIGPSESPEELVPAESVYVLRQGLMRGTRRYVVAISPLYKDNETIYIVTRGKATIRGITMEQEESRIPNPSLTTAPPTTPSGDLDNDAEQKTNAEQDASDLETDAGASEDTNKPLAVPLSRTSDSSQRLPLTSPLALPNSTPQSVGNNIPLPSTFTQLDNSPQRRPLTSPLALPNSTSQSAGRNLPLTSTLTLPNDSPQPLTSPLALPNDTAQSPGNNIPLTSTLTLPNDSPQRLPLTSPLALPNSASQRVPLASPLARPTQTQRPLAVQIEATASPTSQPTVASEPETEAFTTAPAKVSPSPLDEPPIPAGALATTPSATTPWTGLLTFVLFGVALMGLLMGSRE